MPARSGCSVAHRLREVGDQAQRRGSRSEGVHHSTRFTTLVLKRCRAQYGRGVTTVAVIFGGRSSEHAISCISARSVAAALRTGGFDVMGIGITADGAWVSLDPAALEGALPEVPRTAPAFHLAPDPTDSGLDADVVFPVLHGPWGEDGSIQGLLEMTGIPYVGSGVFSSAAAMDKGHMKMAFKDAGLPTNEYVVITPAQWRYSSADVIARVAKLRGPWFVKPARAGSSLGIVKVHASDDLQAAIEAAHVHDPKVIVESSVEGAREIECGVLVNADGVAEASVCAEIVVRAGHEFYDFEAKYLDDSAELIVPAKLAAHVEQRVRELAVAAFEALDCEGLARVDFFVAGDEVLLNEVNTMPGFTSISMFPRMWMAMGMTYEEIVERLVRDALRRGTGLR